MLHACGSGNVRRCFVARGDFRPAIDEEQRIDAFKGDLQRCRVSEIANEDVDPIAATRSCLVRIAHEDARSVAAVEQAFGVPGPDVSRRTRNEECHGGLLRVSGFFRICTIAHKRATRLQDNYMPGYSHSYHRLSGGIPDGYDKK